MTENEPGDWGRGGFGAISLNIYSRLHDYIYPRVCCLPEMTYDAEYT